MDASIYPLEFLYDGNCRICRFDVARLQRADRDGRLRFIDVAAPGFDAAAYGRPQEALLARIHARRANGTLVEGVEVFRLALAAVGHRRLADLSRQPGLACLSEHAYTLFARHRVSLSRRFGGIFERLTPACTDDACSVPGRGQP